ncbi:WD40-repeat-containing domain protein [Flagelloscypha sp. PMI_526]|nr:WD40-repeat-containing domain protein [Flagelloscypha sp. PMI_526]
MPHEQYNIAQTPITAHAFNADRSNVAVSLNDNTVQILGRKGTEWTTIDTLAEHDKIITSIDWAPYTNRIVTSSQDRNAYVWQETPDPETGKVVWKPTLVLLRINRAATHVRWSPKEDKFAVASGARAIAVCSFDPENNWWVSKLLKKPIRSTVLSVDWHPNNVLIAAGSADMKARVLSAYIKEVDEKPAPTVWGSKLPFNTICGEYGSPSGGWVHTVGFSPDGDALAFASHDSTISLVYPGSGAIYNIRIPTLPLTTLTWVSPFSLIAAGHDCQPYLFSGASAGGPGGPPKAGPGRLNSAAFNTFKNADSRGSGGVGAIGGAKAGGSGETKLLTVHQNTITSVRPFEGGPGEVARALVIWNVAEVVALQ